MGPKKPKATFGDVMLGIPSGGASRGEGGRGGGGGRGGERGGPGQGRDAQPRPEGGAPREERRPRGGGSPGGERRGGGGGERRPSGPMVVVKRASGAIETRGPVGEQPAEATATAEATTAAAEASGATPTPTPRPVAPTPAPSTALYEEVPESESFAEMFEVQVKEGGAPGRRGVRLGEKVKGTIFQLGADTAFVSLEGSSKSEAMIELRELKDDEGILRFGVGDSLEAHVIEVGAKGIVLSRALAKGSASMAMLAEARASGMPVEGMVLSVNKGGVEVAIGDQRAFCPISQLDLRYVEKPDQFIGEKLKFRVTEVRDRNVVLSRRSLLEDEQRTLAAETRKTLSEGSIVKGKVSGVRDFGVFVDLGGVEGMIPVSELSYTRVGHPSDVVKSGDEVEVEILRMEPAQPNSPDKTKQKERITLSMRSRQEDPFKKAISEIKEGDRLQGKVVRLQQFGAFVELRPGVDGLVHISALSDRRIAHPRDVVKEGETIWVAVEKIDANEKRIGLRRITEEEAQRPPEERTAPVAAEKTAPSAPAAPRPKAGQVVVGKVDRIEPYGVFLQFPGGKGLLPASETGTERGTDLRKHYALGQEVKVAILDIDASGKIRLSVTAAVRAEERAEVEEWQKTQQPQGAAAGKKGFGTLADLFSKFGK
ncbi:S1 RNA-binding domain-containing protein [Myxococcus llanfairpwllgwyngyllgogerychwyrndrobwllllantysiliogogogochensis]|uniref:S1 RNA-binding domain-containing protein n=1 Tax=Myxococcus llanfairpwllgwyngyllgogerychwyrndrobwllllantysiliogogogochensis TaxID=2590453 RepID=A0A540WSD0_9BACT|nr:S1 RNA-binding domain-containing protein [Myxococcus llanfairpwllgwyngyllgogerychwyrndrobwllllantysiliogogogochensis]TQF11925.1 S1 RNA-binding domain-containing protein [Myxococcus llanfairpwllgwyngyllgogerychwyrndrobwllllantysiliogogogochensis]